MTYFNTYLKIETAASYFKGRNFGAPLLQPIKRDPEVERWDQPSQSLS